MSMRGSDGPMGMTGAVGPEGLLLYMLLTIRITTCLLLTDFYLVY